jgi:hypothetical protein
VLLFWWFYGSQKEAGNPKVLEESLQDAKDAQDAEELA